MFGQQLPSDRHPENDWLEMDAHRGYHLDSEMMETDISAVVPTLSSSSSSSRVRLCGTAQTVVKNHRRERRGDDGNSAAAADDDDGGDKDDGDEGLKRGRQYTSSSSNLVQPKRRPIHVSYGSSPTTSSSTSSSASGSMWALKYPFEAATTQQQQQQQPSDRAWQRSELALSHHPLYHQKALHHHHPASYYENTPHHYPASYRENIEHCQVLRKTEHNQVVESRATSRQNAWRNTNNNNNNSSFQDFGYDAPPGTRPGPSSSSSEMPVTLSRYFHDTNCNPFPALHPPVLPMNYDERSYSMKTNNNNTAFSGLTLENENLLMEVQNSFREFMDRLRAKLCRNATEHGIDFTSENPLIEMQNSFDRFMEKLRAKLYRTVAEKGVAFSNEQALAKIQNSFGEFMQTARSNLPRLTCSTSTRSKQDRSSTSYWGPAMHVTPASSPNNDDNDDNNNSNSACDDEDRSEQFDEEEEEESGETTEGVLVVEQEQASTALDEMSHTTKACDSKLKKAKRKKKVFPNNGDESRWKDRPVILPLPPTMTPEEVVLSDTLYYDPKARTKTKVTCYLCGGLKMTRDKLVITPDENLPAWIALNVKKNCKRVHEEGSNVEATLVNACIPCMETLLIDIQNNKYTARDVRCTLYRRIHYPYKAPLFFDMISEAFPLDDSCCPLLKKGRQCLRTTN